MSDNINATTVTDHAFSWSLAVRAFMESGSDIGIGIAIPVTEIPMGHTISEKQLAMQRLERLDQAAHICFGHHYVVALKENDMKNQDVQSALDILNDDPSISFFPRKPRSPSQNHCI